MLATSLSVDSFEICHRGLVREVNEDSALAIPEQGLWAVADGMGGHSRGDYASQLITHSLCDMTIARGNSLNGLLDQVEHLLQHLNERMLKAAQEISETAIVGSTVVVMVARENTAGLLWAGDSRAYRLRSGTLEQLTIDHTVANELIRQQGWSADQAAQAQDAETLTMAAGASPFNPERCIVDIAPGDRFCLCSDGLNKLVSDQEIAEIMTDRREARAATEHLVQQALDRGAIDNISTIVINFS